MPVDFFHSWYDAIKIWPFQIFGHLWIIKMITIHTYLSKKISHFVITSWKFTNLFQEYSKIFFKPASALISLIILKFPMNNDHFINKYFKHFAPWSILFPTWNNLFHMYFIEIILDLQVSQPSYFFEFFGWPNFCHHLNLDLGSQVSQEWIRESVGANIRAVQIHHDIFECLTLTPWPYVHTYVLPKSSSIFFLKLKKPYY